MNKGLFSFIVLFLTTITMGIMFWSTSSSGIFLKEINNRKLEESFVEKEFDTSEIINKIEENILKKKVDFNKNTSVEEQEYNKSKDDKKNIVDREPYSQNQKEKNTLEEAKDNIEGNYLGEDRKNSDEDDHSLNNKIDVFKVNKYSIPSKIKISDKGKLLSIAKSLSFSDYRLLLEHIKRNDELDAAVDIFRILKDRLNEDEYNFIKDIMNPYINIELIESNI